MPFNSSLSGGQLGFPDLVVRHGCLVFFRFF